MKKKEVANSLLRILFWAALSAGFLFLFSYSTSPFYANCWGHDSADFQLLGRDWADGLLPYRDLFELKGALLFLLDAIGYGIGGRHGVFLIQILFFVFFLEAAYQSCLLFTGRRAALVVPVCMLAILCRTFDEGNMTEDWSLPFLAFSFLFVLRWAKGYSEGRKEHPPWYAFVYGFCFGCIFFVRVNNAIGICCCVFVIACYLIKDRAWKNLAQNVLAITLGALTVCLPFCAYFFWKGALYEMWYSMVLFGLSYVSGDFWDTKMKISLLLWAMAALSALHWRYDKKSPLSYMGLLSAVLTGLMLYKSRGYEHYYMILCAYVPLYCYMTARLWEKGKKGFAAVFLMGLVVQMGVSAGYLPNRLNRQERLSANAALNESLDEILEMIPEQDRSLVAFYNMEAQAYMYTGIRPCTRYFAYQDFYATIREDMKEKITQQFETVQPAWIVVKMKEGEPGIEIPELKTFLEEGYTLRGSVENQSNKEIYGAYAKR